MQKITPFLWFDDKAEEAAKFYVSVFKNSKILDVARYDKEGAKEVDYYWEKLSKGGDKSAQQCGWLKDRYGLSWQVVPTVLEGLLRDKDAGKSQRVMAAMLKMKKIEIEGLKRAYRGK